MNREGQVRSMSGLDRDAPRPEESASVFTGLLTRLESGGGAPVRSGPTTRASVPAEEREPVSPELALVDPELGRWARTELPDAPLSPPRLPPRREREAVPRSVPDRPARPPARLTPAEFAQVARRGRVVRRPRAHETTTRRGRARSLA